MQHSLSLVVFLSPTSNSDIMLKNGHSTLNQLTLTREIYLYITISPILTFFNIKLFQHSYHEQQHRNDWNWSKTNLNVYVESSSSILVDLNTTVREYYWIHIGVQLGLSFVVDSTCRLASESFGFKHCCFCCLTWE